jgi:hypothetical protein
VSGRSYLRLDGAAPEPSGLRGCHCPVLVAAGVQIPVSAVTSCHQFGTKSVFMMVMIEGSRGRETIGHLRSRVLSG